MWEAIARNRRRSAVLLAALAAVLVLAGAAFGAAMDPHAGAGAGAVVASIAFLGIWGVSSVGGSRMLLASVGAKPLEKADAPRLWNVVEEMTIAAGLPAMPQVHLVEDDAPNAFAVGHRPDRSAVAVTSGLLRRLDRDELQGVVAHEIGHIANQDTRFLTTASVIVGSLALVADLWLRANRVGLRRTGRDKGQAGLVILALAVAVLAPIAARLLYLACSRQREFLADASAARFTRYPEGLASALDKIAQHASEMRTANRAVQPLFIVTPLEAAERGSWLSTHPPTATRVRILRSMSGGAGYRAYEDAFRVVEGKGVLGDRTLSGDTAVPIRAASPEPAEHAAAVVERATEANAALDRVSGYLPIACTCGVGIKVPPGFADDAITCPRCGTTHAVPRAHARRFTRTGAGWEAFRCDCGRTIQLSPSFAGSHVRCPGCRADVAVESPGVAESRP
jgi:heat shock protein HtpX